MNYNILMTKQNLRAKFIRIGKLIKDKNSLSDIIAENVLKSSAFAAAKNVGIYVNFGDEVSTKKIISQSLSSGKNVSVPVVAKDEMNFYSIKSLNDLREMNNFGIRQPAAERKNLVDPTKLDLLIVPGICFDLAGNRIGFGKGFYDKFLADSSAVKLGICFEKQLLKDEKIPTEKTDVAMDFVVTESGIYECN